MLDYHIKKLIIFIFVLCIAGCATEHKSNWYSEDNNYRFRVVIHPNENTPNTYDECPAAVDVDFTTILTDSLGIDTVCVDISSIEVFRYDPASNEILDAPDWPFAKREGELASRFLDSSLPWMSHGRTDGKMFPRSVYFRNIRGNGEKGRLTFTHTTDSVTDTAYYAVYFSLRRQKEPRKNPRRGFIGDGLALCTESSEAFTGAVYNYCDLKDWDDDGDIDIIVGTDIRPIIVYYNTGNSDNPQFNTFGEYLLDKEGHPQFFGTMPHPCFSDWNNDGREDIVVGNGRGTIHWYENTGADNDKVFAPRRPVISDGIELEIPSEPSPESPYSRSDYAPSIEIVDWDGDGDDDLLAGGIITGYIWLYENTGKHHENGTPVLKASGYLEADGEPLDTGWGAHPCVFDFDSDGDMDLVSGMFSGPEAVGESPPANLFFFENIKDRENPELARIEAPVKGQMPSMVYGRPRAADLTGDGLPDIIVTEMRSAYIGINIGKPDAPLWEFQLLEMPWGIHRPDNLKIASQIFDIDGDGGLDFIVSPQDHGGNGVPEYHLRKKGGVHGNYSDAKPLLPEGSMIKHPAPYGDDWTYIWLIDFEGDGDNDILWADGPGNAYLHRNIGTDEKPAYDTKGELLKNTSGEPLKVGPEVVPFDEITDFTVKQGSRAAITAADFNGDGLTDVVMSDTYGKVIYYENRTSNESPVFDSGITLGKTDGNRAKAYAHDWNGDGRTDLLVSDWSAGTYYIMNESRDGVTKFGQLEPLALPESLPWSMKTMLSCDWNGDGDADIITQSAYPWFCWMDGSYIRNNGYYVMGTIIAIDENNM